MATTYRVTVSTQLGSMLPEDRVVNVLHFQHTLEPVAVTDLDVFAGQVLDAFDNQWFGSASAAWRECRIYPIAGPPPHDPLATKTRGQATVSWTPDYPREIALCLSFRGGPRPWQRGRIYLSPQTATSWRGTATLQARPAANLRTGVTTLATALGNAGGVDWDWGVWSKSRGEFFPINYAWCDDEWDIQRRRGGKPTTRSSVTLSE